jgi:lipoyl-dependent peroxiredoxin
MKKRNATAVWKGSGKEGSGTLKSGSGLFAGAQYSYKDRFEEGPGTNPEELIAAAHAGCYSMKLSFILGAAGFTPDEINTDCYITLDSGTITKSELIVRAKVPGIDGEKFQECAQEAKTTCPVSKAITGVEISVDASLV